MRKSTSLLVALLAVSALATKSSAQLDSLAQEELSSQELPAQELPAQELPPQSAPPQEILPPSEIPLEPQELPPQEVKQEISEEAPPAPEPPYPGSEEGNFAADPSMVQEETREPALERPQRIDEEGIYHYSTKIETPTVANPHGLQKPLAADKGGNFLYDSRPQIPPYNNSHNLEKPVQILASGETYYKTDVSPTRASMSFRAGIITKPEIINPDNGNSFEDVYGSSVYPMINVDYEWRLTSSIGRLGLKVGSGIMVASGKGKFKNASRANEVPEESFTFALFPNQVALNYKFQYSDTQLIVPYVEGGGGYFTFAEIRDDGKKPKFGAAPVAIGAGGIAVLMDRFDPKAIRQLDADYGINHIWLTAEARGIFGLHNTLDFTSQSFNLGFIADF